MVMVKDAKDYSTILRRNRFPSRSEIGLPLTWDGKETFSFTGDVVADFLPEDQIYIRIIPNHWRNKMFCIVIIIEICEKSTHQDCAANVTIAQAKVVAC